MFVQHRSTEASNAGCHGWVERDQILTDPGVTAQTHFNFLTGHVADFAKVDFGKTAEMQGLRVGKQWKCPYIFMDCPEEYNTQFAEETIAHGINAAMERTSSPCGMVVMFCQAFQIAAAQKALGHCRFTMDSLTNGDVIAIVPHCACKPGDSSKMSMSQFPGRMFFAVVAFWGEFSSGGQQMNPDRFPSGLLVDKKF